MKRTLRCAIAAPEVTDPEQQHPYLKEFAVLLSPAEAEEVMQNIDPMSIGDVREVVWSTLSPATNPPSRIAASRKIWGKTWLNIAAPTKEALLAGIRENHAALDRTPQRTFQAAPRLAAV